MVSVLASICILLEVYYLIVYPYSRADKLELALKCIKEGGPSHKEASDSLTYMDLIYMGTFYVYFGALVLLLLTSFFYAYVFTVPTTVILIFWLVKNHYKLRWRNGSRDRFLLISDSVMSIILLLYALKIHLHLIL